MTPTRADLNARERRLVDRLRTPLAVQRWLNRLPYNQEKEGETLRSLRGVVACGTAHCMEAALAAAAILEQHGYPPIVMSFESVDKLDHVLFVYREGGRWGSVGRSRDPGLHGRKAVFATPRALARSYLDPYIDLTGRITGFAVVNLAVLGDYDWRLSLRNVWKAEALLIDYPHRPLVSSLPRANRLRARYRAYLEAHSGRKPIDYPGKERWTELPREFRLSRGRSSASAW